MPRSKNSLPERVARLEEQVAERKNRLTDEAKQRFMKMEENCDKQTSRFAEKLEIINREMGGLEDGIKDLSNTVKAMGQDLTKIGDVVTAASKSSVMAVQTALDTKEDLIKTIKTQVKAPMTSTDKRYIWVAVITSITSIVIAIISYIPH